MASWVCASRVAIMQYYDGQLWRVESNCSSVESITCYDLQAYLGLVNCILTMTTYDQTYAEIEGIYKNIYKKFCFE